MRSVKIGGVRVLRVCVHVYQTGTVGDDGMGLMGLQLRREGCMRLHGFRVGTKWWTGSA